MATSSHTADGHYEGSGTSTDPARGREASRPAEIPARGWWDILVRVKNEISKDNVSLIAAGLALYALLAVFPALAAAVSIYGLFSSPEEITRHMQAFSSVLPPDAAKILEGQLQALSQSEQALSIGLILGVALALWSARKGMVALMTALNIAYDERERRGFFKQILVSLAFTIVGVIGFLLVLLIGVAVPLALEALPLGNFTQTVIAGLRWAILWGVAVLGMALLYRYGPDRHEAKWRWVSWGSAIAASLWLVGSLLFALYVRNSGSYGETYGALGGVVILLMWFYLTGYTLILGAEINSEMERQTAHDTTRGHEKPMGSRGAYAADTLGPSNKDLKS